METRGKSFIRNLIVVLVALAFLNAYGVLAREPLQEPDELLSVEAGEDQTTNEGQAVSFSGSFEDDDIYAGHSVEWDFGDSTTSTGSLTPTHTYAQDGTYTVTLTVTNLSTLTSMSDSLTVTGENVPPSVDAGPDVEIDQGDTFSSSGSFSDPGEEDWSGTVDYGDGSGEQVLSLGADKSFSLNHTYTGAGSYTVTVTITDDDTSSSDTATVTVTAPENTQPSVDAGGDASLNEGGTLSRSGSFSDPDEDSWSATVDYGDGSGVQDLALEENKTFNLSHSYIQNGSYTVMVTVSDGEASGSDAFTVTVNNVSPSVDAGPDAVINEGDIFSSSGSFSDPGEDDWSATVDYGDGSGEQTLSLNADKTFNLNHPYTEAGDYTVTVTVSDPDASDSDTATVTVTAPENTPPAVDAGANASLDEGGTLSRSGSFSDPDEDDWSATIDYGDGSGVQALSLNEDKTFSLSHTYTEDGSYTVTVTVSDGETSGSDAFTVTVENLPPAADAGGPYALDEGSQLHLDGSATDPGQSDSLTFHWDLDGDGQYDDATGATPLFSAAGIDGPANLTIGLQVVDDDGGEGTATASLTVQNVTPTAKDDAYQVSEDGTLAPEPPGVLGNDTDPGPEDLTAELVTDVSNGTLDLNGDGSFTYTPGQDFVGTDSFTYQVNDGGADSNIATVQIEVGGTNDSPTNLALSDSSVEEGLPVGTLVGVFSTTDADADDQHTYRLISGDGDEGNDSFKISGNQLLTAAVFDYEAQASYSVLVQTEDTGGATFRKAFTITVTDTNEPPVALGESYDAGTGETLSVPAEDGVLANDSDPDGDALTAVLVSGPEQAATFTLNEDGSFTYTPGPDFTGEDHFTYFVKDESGLESETIEAVLSVLDAASPRVAWMMPAEDGAVIEVGNEIILLRVEASDDIQIESVYFYRWDAVNEVYIDIATVEAPPFEIEFNTSVLNPGFNQVFVKAYDQSGNESGRKWIWLYKLPPSHYQYFALVAGQ